VADGAVRLQARGITARFGPKAVVKDATLAFPANTVTAIIGPSGCGKSTFLRSVNRINERLGYVRTTGSVEVMGADILAPEVELVQVRKQLGMVFQRPNPLPISVRENVLFGYRLHADTGRIPHERQDEIVEGALRQVLLWDKVKDRLDARATELSLEEQQKLCIARLLPVKPAVLLMDEPCSALDPIPTARIEDLMDELSNDYAIVIVTHSMQQAARVSQRTAFFHLGDLIEVGETSELFIRPGHQLTEDYITGRFG